MLELTSSQLNAVLNYLGYSNLSRFQHRPDSGVEAVFIPLNEKFGIKVYRPHRDEAARIGYMWARIIRHLSGSPRVWGLGEVQLYGNTHVYFYMEIASPLSKDRSLDEDTLYETMYASQMDLFQRTGVLMADMHLGNWAWFHGKCVPIDFGAIEHRAGDRGTIIL